MSIQVDIIPFITKTEVTQIRLPEEISDLINSMPYAMADDYSTTGPPDILLGNDYFLCFITGKPVPVHQNVYYLPTKIGLVLGGTFQSFETIQEPNPVLLTISNRPDYDVIYSETPYSPTKAVPDLEKFWSLENIGITDDPKDNSDELAEDQFEKTARLNSGRWEVGWPYNEKINLLPTNFGQSYGRFVTLATRMQKSDQCVREEYANIIQQQVDNDIIEDVPTAEVKRTPHKVHYLSHHAVIKIQYTTTKVRIVYDGSAKPTKNTVSLNQCMHRGPVLLPDLVGLILRFRLQPIALTADIEKAFLQLSLRHEDRDVTRFLWFNNPLEPDARSYRTMRFKRVPFGVISSPSLLAQTIRLHLKLANSDVSRLVGSNLYVDNLLLSVESEIEATKVYQETKSLFSACSMNMRAWISNSKALTQNFSEQDCSKTHHAKILGLKWDSASDVLALSADWSKEDHCATKRQILKAIASIFDPTGIYQPVILLAKLFLRKLWLTVAAWDDPLSHDLQLEWKEIHRRILPIFKHSVKRRFLSSPMKQPVSICVFCDASGDAFCACVHLRVATNDPDRYECALVYAKSRVTPKENKRSKTSAQRCSAISLPRLELLALTIAARMGQFVRTALHLADNTPIIIFSDSTCSLGWLRSDKKLPIFVKNRVAKIHSLEFAEYRHVSSQDNAADVCSRGIDGASLIRHHLWWQGPTWLSAPKNTWPESREMPAVTSEQLRSVTEASASILHSFVAREDPSEAIRPICSSPFMMDSTKYSSLGRLLRVTTLCLRWCYRFWKGRPDDFNIRNVALSQVMNTFEADQLRTSHQLSTATIMWIKYEQSSHFSAVLTTLNSKRKTSHQLVRQLDLFIDGDGLIRCGGRLHQMEMPPDAINPILLPTKSYLTRLIVKQVHSRCLHTGVNHTLNQVRMYYWIPKGRSLVREFILKCLVCRKLKGQPYALPQMPDLPREREARSHPFQFTGVDYLGPINVKIQEEKHKQWIVVFTCFTTRAVHLESVSDCTAQSFVNSLSRFISRRGSPEKMLSDNAPQFKLTKTLFDIHWNKTLRDASVISYMRDHQIEWCFIIELAPWQGGIYERLMRTIKNLFRAEVGRRLLSADALNTLIVEIESIVNSRPITYVNTDYKSGVALRPVDFLTNLSTGLPEAAIGCTPLPPGEATRLLSQMWKSNQRRLDKLWKRWREDYLLNLRESQTKSHARQRRNLPHCPKVDEIVLVHNEDLPRGCWKLAKVIEIIVSKDAKIRAVELKLPNGQHIRRTINHLYPLEIPTTSEPEAIHNRSSYESSEGFDGFDEAEVEAAKENISAWEENRNQILADGQVNLALGLAHNHQIHY